MNNIKIFENQEFGAIRTMGDEKGEPLFCVKDVARVLGYNNSRDAMRKHVEIDDVAKSDTMDALGRMQPTTFINKSGLYSPSLYDQQVEVLNMTSFDDGVKYRLVYSRGCGMM